MNHLGIRRWWGGRRYTNKKENKIFPRNFRWEQSNITYRLLLKLNIRKPFLIYVWLCTRSFMNSLIWGNFSFSFFTVYFLRGWILCQKKKTKAQYNSISFNFCQKLFSCNFLKVFFPDEMSIKKISIFWCKYVFTFWGKFYLPFILSFLPYLQV
jgi:hypothetical protein